MPLVLRMLAIPTSVRLFHILNSDTHLSNVLVPSENFALKVFDLADSEDQSGNATRYIYYMFFQLLLTDVFMCFQFDC